MALEASRIGAMAVTAADETVRNGEPDLFSSGVGASGLIPKADMCKEDRRHNQVSHEPIDGMIDRAGYDVRIYFLLFPTMQQRHVRSVLTTRGPTHLGLVRE